MPYSRPDELVRAEELMHNGKLEEAFEKVSNFEKKSGLTHEDQLSALLIKGWLYVYKLQYKEAVDIGERAYELCKEIELISESSPLLDSIISEIFVRI